MSSRDLDALHRERPQAGDSLGEVGRARRFACILQTGTPVELWALPASDLGFAKKLIQLGTKGVGGFDAGWGEDADGAFLLRRIPSKSVDALGKGERLEGLTALAKIRDLAGALGACEGSAIFPGPLRTAEIALGSAGRAEAWIAVESFVRARLGALAPGQGVTAPSPRWTPPEQAAGAPWDNAANRYVLGLVAYRLLAGAHPFSGIGLRDAMKAQEASPPPFDEEVARGLRPGIQSLVLAMLDPDPRKRPGSAAEIVTRCEEILQSDVPLQTNRVHAPAPSPPAPVVAIAKPVVPRAITLPKAPSSWKRVAIGIAPIAIGLGIAGLALASAAQHEEAPPPPTPKALSRGPLDKTTAETCAPCHARQVAEWQRSVMAHAAKSPLFGALESVVEEQVGRDERCPNGAGVLRKTSGARGGDVCRDEKTGLTFTGSGGEHWCVNCHSASDNLRTTMPAWSASASSQARKPVRDLLSPQALEGISCAVCHTTIGPVHAGGGYEGNPSWVSTQTGTAFSMRPEDSRGVRGIANSGYLLDEKSFLEPRIGSGGAGDPIVHRATSNDTKAYTASSEFCGACHDVRLFGSDTLGARDKGEHFKRLRNAYSEWKSWSDAEKAAGRRAATCQDCHMSLYPGVCVADGAKAGAKEGCPPGFHFEARAPGEKARGMIASSSSDAKAIASHYFTSVEVPLTPEFPDGWATDTTLDASGVPLGLEVRREQMLRHTFRFELGKGSRIGGRIELPIEIQNVGAGHRVPAGFSQEREIWVELTVKDARGSIVYEVGKVAGDEADLRDKAFVRTTTRDDVLDFKGRPLGIFGADVVDGPDVGKWSPNPALGGSNFRGRGLINFQNGFLRCVKCIGFVDAQGRCQAGPGQGTTRADRFADGAYDIDTGECRSNLEGLNALFETYFPVGALDADRGVAKAPDAIIDTRSAPPGVNIRYVYELDAPGRQGPFKVEARLRFRPFPPFLLRAFADYESRKASQGLRPSGAQLTGAMLRRNKIIDLGEVSATID